MSRTARLIDPRLLVHVRCRFVDGRFAFDDSSRLRYLKYLDRVLVDSDWTLLSYALMSSHIHLGLISGEMSLHSWLHPLNTAIAGWISNRRRFQWSKTLGQVFGDRPGTNILPLERAFNLIAYHHNNPVNAEAVESARDSRWTSHRQYLGLDTERVTTLMVRRGLELCAMDVSSFDAEVRRTVHRPTLCDGSPTAIVAIVSNYFEVSIHDVSAGSRSRCAVTARRVALAIGASWGYSCTRMAAELRISRVAAAKLLRTCPDDVAKIARELGSRWRLVS